MMQIIGNSGKLVKGLARHFAALACKIHDKPIAVFIK
jgi:hypothetical protein